MPTRQILPSDDLYARLGVPTDASVEAIEVAWRAMLRRHHPDVAGDEGLEVAKRINVAHDWLSDPGLRARYDRERGLRSAVGPRGADHASWHPRGGGPQPTPPPVPTRRETETAIDRFLERVANLTPTDIDRLALAEPPPIAFGATIRRFLPDERRDALDSIEAAVAVRLPAAARRPAIRDAIDGFATELVLGKFLDSLLSEPFRGRAAERLTRGWDSAVGQPRYGPNTPAVEALIGRLSDLDEDALRVLGRTGTRERLGEEPWPAVVSRDDDDALRVSSELAQMDARAAVSDARQRRAAARLAHLLVLRHAFDKPVFETLVAPWRPWLLPPDPVTPRVRRPAAG